MKRDEDLLRSILFEMEASESDMFHPGGQTLGESADGRRKAYHCKLLADQGFVAPVGTKGHYIRLTSYGHDFIETIRNDTIWHEIKSRSAEVGGLTIGLMFELGKAYLKQKLKDSTGLEL